MKRHRIFSVVGVIAILGALGGGVFLTVGETGKPRINLSPDITTVGKLTAFEADISDEGSGLAEVIITIKQDEVRTVLMDSRYRDHRPPRQSVAVTIDPVALKLREGKAVLTITATDGSLWKNTAVLTKQLHVDFIPPRISLFTPINHLNPGGTGVILYGVSKPVSVTGVWVDNHFSSAYPVVASGKQAYVAYFAIPTTSSSTGPQISIAARDKGGNEATVTVPRLMMKKMFRSDKMPLSDVFLQQKMPEFQSLNPVLKDKPPVEVFAYINSVLRDENNKTIQDICRVSTPRPLWQGTFLRMKDAAPMAQFGDHRTYVYGGRVVGESLHLGVDLASTAGAPIEAANDGLVVYTGYLGIYGNTVIIDHGYGLFSLYAHLSQIQVDKGMAVKKGDVIGKSGMTGLAGGDHLHFSIIVGGRFVDPKEWWDPHWIQDNVIQKLAVSF